jgi:genome maintenance exonuclease 1
MIEEKFITLGPPTPLDDLKVINESGVRLYQVPNGEKYPSVTTATGWAKRDFFKKWRQDPKNKEESARCLKRGNEFHYIVEDYLQNKENFDENRSDTGMLLFEQIKSLLGNIGNIYAQEAPLWSSTLELAGRVDCVAEYDGELAIIDFKTSTKEKKEEWVENYFLQATAYAIMWHERTRMPISKIVILISCDDGASQVFIKDPMDYVPKLYDCLKKFKREFYS